MIPKYDQLRQTLQRRQTDALYLEKIGQKEDGHTF